MITEQEMPPGQAHQFHKHPEMDEIIYVLAGEAEPWGDEEKLMLKAGQTAHIPKDVIYGTCNPGSEMLEFLAMLSPAKSVGPVLVDVSQDEPWESLRPWPPVSS